MSVNQEQRERLTNIEQLPRVLQNEVIGQIEQMPETAKEFYPNVFE